MQTRLFPYLPMDALGKREKYISRDFNEKHLPAVGVHKLRCKVFHSFADPSPMAIVATRRWLSAPGQVPPGTL